MYFGTRYKYNYLQITVNLKNLPLGFVFIYIKKFNMFRYSNSNRCMIAFLWI